MKKLELSLALVAAAVGAANITPAPAQAQDGDNFSRDRNVSVRQRPKPEYDVSGIQMGSFTLLPEVLLGVESTDNVFGTATDEQSDTVFTATPSARLESDWRNHELNFGVTAPNTFYSDFDDANTSELIATVDGRLDVYRDFFFRGGAVYGDRAEPLSSSPTTLPLAEPIEYTETGGNIGVTKVFNRLMVSADLSTSKLDYNDGVLFNLTPVDQDDRDRTLTRGVVRFDYAVSPATALFVAVGANQRDYDLDPPSVIVNRDSEGYDALVGANFDLTNLVRGEVGVGYFEQEYDDVSIGDSSGLAVRANLEWFPDELVTVNVGASREVADAGAVGAASYVANNAHFGVDYEWRRNVVLGANVAYSMDDYNGIDREDTRLSAELSADYLVNRGVALFAEAGHYEQDSEGLDLGREYDTNRVMVGIRLRR